VASKAMGTAGYKRRGNAATTPPEIQRLRLSFVDTMLADSKILYIPLWHQAPKHYTTSTTASRPGNQLATTGPGQLQLLAAPTGLRPKATKANAPPPTTTTNPPLNPQRWAHQQCPALNISNALAQHILGSLVSATQSLHSPDTSTPPRPWLPFPHRTTTTFLDPLLYFELLYLWRCCGHTLLCIC
jgi:hypothetical protein